MYLATNPPASVMVALQTCRHGNSSGAAADDQDFMVRRPGHHGSPVELARPLWPRAFARQTPDHYTQPNVHRRPTRSRRPQIFRTRTTAEAKCGMRGSRLDQAPLSRNAVPRLGVLV